MATISDNCKRLEAIYKKNEVQSQTYSFADIKDFTLTQAKINKWLEVFRTVAIPVMYPFVLVFSYVYRIIQVLIYAAIGLLFAQGFRTKIEYPAMLRLAVVAVTPAIIINTIVSLSGYVFCGMWLLYFAIAMVYLAFGVKAVSESQQPMDEQTFGEPPEQFGDRM